MQAEITLILDGFEEIAAVFAALSRLSYSQEASLLNTTTVRAVGDEDAPVARRTRGPNKKKGETVETAEEGAPSPTDVNTVNMAEVLESGEDLLAGNEVNAGPVLKPETVKPEVKAETTVWDEKSVDDLHGEIRNRVITHGAPWLREALEVFGLSKVSALTKPQAIKVLTSPVVAAAQ